MLSPGSATADRATTAAHGDRLVYRGLKQQLEQTGRLLAEEGPLFSAEMRKLEDLIEKLDAGRFHLAVLGQFKRGKSTLLNALLGEPLLPTSVVPLTAVPTFIRQGGSPKIRVTFGDDRGDKEYAGGSVEERRAFLESFVTEQANPKNRLSVETVDVFSPSPLLAKGVILIDTPGIGSTYRHNTEATLNFLPQCDAALFLVSADPPMTEVEADFLREVRARVSRLFFVLNKIDYLNEEERVVATEFLAKTLREQIGIENVGPIFPVSARVGLEARLTDDAALWHQSGLGDLELHLIDFMVSEKTAAIRNAVRRRADDVIESVLMHLRLRARSLELPLEEIEQRLDILDTELARASRERLVAQDLLEGDKRRGLEHLEEQAAELRQGARSHLHAALRECGAVTSDGRVDEEAAKEAVAAAIPAFFEKKLGALAQQMDKQVHGMLEPHQRRVDELVERVRRTTAELFEVPYHPLDSARVFEFKRQPYWVTHKWDSSFSPIPENWFEHFLPVSMRRKRAIERISERIEDLVMHNVENLRWAALQNVNRSFVRFTSCLDECLEETIAATKGAVEAACERRTREAETIAQETLKLNKKVEDLERLRQRIKAEPD